MPRGGADACRRRWLTKSIVLGWRAVLSLPVVVFVIGCDQSPTWSDRAPVPSFSIAAGSGTWTTKTPMSTGRGKGAVGEIDGILYAVGGYDNGGALATVEAYDPATNMWTTKAPIPTPRAALGVGVINGILYAVGGYELLAGNVSSATVEAYDPTTNTWTTKAPMLTPRGALGVGVINGILYAVSGDNLTTVEA